MTILDESAKAVETEVNPILGHNACEDFLFIGDPQQLPPLFKGEDKDNNLSPQRRLSLFERLVHNGFRHIMLNEQFRMVEEIASIVSEVFYKGQLRTAPLALATSEGRHEQVRAITDFNRNKFAVDSP